MKWLDWQNKIMENDDLDVFEVINPRNSGKTFLALNWVIENADVSIMIVPVGTVRYYAKVVNELGITNKIYFVTNLDQLRGINTHQKKRVKVAVDECFAGSSREIKLKDIDSFIGHIQYKVLFIGTRKKPDDKFRIPYSYKVQADMISLMAERHFNPSYLTRIMQDLTREQLMLEFGLPTELE